MKPVRILVVDDESMIRELLLRILRGKGYQVALAENAVAAMKILQTDRDFSLILCDIHMPGISGTEFAEYIKKLSIPVTMLTAYPTKENLQKSIKAGAKDFILKEGFKADAFLKRIEKLLDTALTAEEKRAPSHGKSEERPSQNGNDRSLPKLLSLDDIEKKIGKVKEIKALPFIAAEILQLTSDEDSGAKELTSLISRDQGIASKVLQVSNSAFYRSKTRVRTLEQAVVNIGFHGIRDIALAVAIVDRFKGESGGLNRVELWKHSLATAVIAKNLARCVDYEQPEAAFLAGLLHDLGVIFFDEYFNKEYAQAMTIMRESSGMPGDLEQEMLSLSHAAFGKKVLDHWNLPEKYRDVAVFHHHSFDRIMNLKSKDRTLLALVIVADEIAQSLPFSAQGIEMINRLDNRWFEFLGIQSAEQIQETLQQSPKEVYDLLSILLLHQSEEATLNLPLEPVTDDDQGILYVIDESNAIYDPVSLRYQSRYCIRKSAFNDINPGKAKAVFYYVDSEAQARNAPQHLTRLRVEQGCDKPVFVLAHAALQPLLSSYQQALHPVSYWPLRSATVDQLLNKYDAEGKQA